MKILVVDDSQTVRKILTRELRGGGYEVVEADRGEKALRMLEEGLAPDLITMDVEMPGLDGFATCERIRRREREREATHRVPVIFITANDNLEDRERGFELGASEFVIKPAPEGEILRRVERTLALTVPLKGLTAVVAEDSEPARLVVKRCLQAEGVKVLEATDGAEALELAKSHPDEVDLVITDFMMPRMRGDEFCRRLRMSEGFQHTPVIFLSAVAEKSSILEMFRAGATDYLLKPFAKEELLARIRVHLEVRQLNRKLDQQVKALKELGELKDQFLAVASHDLRSPLTCIQGFIEFLLADDDIQGEHREFLGYMENSANYLVDLVNDVLDLARIEAEKQQTLELHPLDVAEVADSAVGTMRHMAMVKDIDLELDNRYTTGKPVIRGEENSLRRILNNLISNAIKFTPDQGRVTVEVGPRDGGDVLLAVQDSGIGIEPDKIPHLFDRFSSASREGTAGEKSTGLGLAITRELVQRHFGRIDVSSTPDKGTRFEIVFPSAASQPPAETASQQT